jgi:hypothetical protein
MIVQMLTEKFQDLPEPIQEFGLGSVEKLVEDPEALLVRAVSAMGIIARLDQYLPKDWSQWVEELKPTETALISEFYYAEHDAIAEGFQALLDVWEPHKEAWQDQLFELLVRRDFAYSLQYMMFLIFGIQYLFLGKKQNSLSDSLGQKVLALLENTPYYPRRLYESSGLNFLRENTPESANLWWLSAKSQELLQ